MSFLLGNKTLKFLYDSVLFSKGKATAIKVKQGKLLFVYFKDEKGKCNLFFIIFLMKIFNSF